MATEIKPNADAGKKLKTEMGSDVIDIDSDELLSIASQFQAHADNMRPLIASSAKIGETAETEAKQFTTDYEPAPVYGTTVTSLKKVSSHFSTQITKVIEQLESDAGALVWIAKNNDQTQEDNAKKVKNIDTDTVTV